MAALKICLLISEDPDDYLILSEGLSEVSKDVILLMCADGKRSQDLLLQGLLKPDYLLLDYSLRDGDINELLAALRSNDLLKMSRVAVFSEMEPETFRNDNPDCLFFVRRSSYAEIRNVLTELIRN